MKHFPNKLLLASPRGFCAGVKRAINTLEGLIEKNPNKTIYCYHQIVHNKTVVKDFTNKGVIFVDDLSKVPEKSILVFSSHGVSPALIKQAKKNKLKIIDATCPFVIKTHKEVKDFAKKNFKIIYIGQKDHDETIGTTDEALNQTIIVSDIEDIKSLDIPKNTQVAIVTQTTLSFDETKKLVQALEKKFPELIKPKLADICQATQNRQNGVKKIVKMGAEIVIVLGSKNSSNSNKLKTVAENAGARAYLLDDITEIDIKDLENIKCVGLTAGASLPEYKIVKAIKWFKKHGITEIEEVSAAVENNLL
ncbi:MAG: 4-hydroxy-3-methylbut-2-enyl diphosphate reductase [Microgenomates group bacterium]|jgi:4-hydroxy-3-methylbut-2-enyl diphosphate reductase